MSGAGVPGRFTWAAGLFGLPGRAARKGTGPLTRPWRHIRALWGHYWIIPLLPAAYAAVLFLTGEIRPEHVLIAIVAAVLGFGTRSTHALFVTSFPGLLAAWGSDAIRYLRPIFVTPDRVLGCSLRDAELALFSVAPGETLPDFFAVHHSAFFDVLAAIPYGIFWLVCVVYVCWLFYADRARLDHYLWALLLTYLVTFATWLAVPAAPPWYIQAHGCVIDVGVAPSAAALSRVDQLFGIDYFQAFYGRGPITFGALPSMHCAFPMIGLLVAWRSSSWRTRPLHLLYAGSMILASVYLGHHWLLDGLLGWLISAAAVIAAGALLGSGLWLRPSPERHAAALHWRRQPEYARPRCGDQPPPAG